jgi:indole-3-glycerol phosphate synthase
MSILDEIFAHKAVEVQERKMSRSLAEMRGLAERSAPGLDFIAALRRPEMGTGTAGYPTLIAEIKCASPSRGQLVKDFDPLRIARTYLDNGAGAISVLTDERYFKGSLDYLAQTAAIAGRVPLLRKDFILDPYQVYEARANGADAVLLIAASLDAQLLNDLHALAHELNMAALVEVHTRAEVEKALQACRPPLLGINNRNLHDFSVRLETTLELQTFAPKGTTLVAESGIHTEEDARRLGAAGIDAILVGEALVTAADMAAMVRSLSGYGLAVEQAAEPHKESRGLL